MMSFLTIGVAAQLISLGLTFLFVVNDIHSSANNQVSLRACAIWPSFTFFLTFAIGNAIATLFVPIMVPGFVATQFFDPLNDFARAFTYAVLGVIGFEVILSNLTYSTTGADYSPLRNRIAKARDYAVEQAVDREIAMANRQQQRRARDLHELVPEPELNGHIFENLGAGVVGDLEDVAVAEGAPPVFVKCNALAARKPVEADAIVKDARRRKGRWWRLKNKMR